MSPLVIIILLALIQGVTEMLPVSSSGHLAIGRQFWELEATAGWLEVFLHTGTLVSIIIYYRTRILELITGVLKNDAAVRIQAIHVVIASIPVCIIGLFANQYLDEILNNIVLIGGCLMVTGFMLLSLFKKTRDDQDMTMGRALIIGLLQSIAILPGISRSGTTIVTARHLGVSPKKAAEFSFLISLVPLAGASAVKTLEAIDMGMGSLSVSHILIGASIAAVTGFISLVVLNRMLGSNTFRYFGFYCLLAGAALLAL